MSDWLSPNPPDIADPFSTTKKKRKTKTNKIHFRKIGLLAKKILLRKNGFQSILREERNFVSKKRLKNEFRERIIRINRRGIITGSKKMKSSTITYALLIGGVFGVIVYGVAKNNIGFFALILLIFLAYKFFYNPESNKKNEELKRLLKERNLK